MVGIISQFLFIRYFIMLFSDKASIFPGLFEFSNHRKITVEHLQYFAPPRKNSSYPIEQ